jgi:hypothetical protein
VSHAAEHQRAAQDRDVQMRLETQMNNLMNEVIALRGKLAVAESRISTLEANEETRVMPKRDETWLNRTMRMPSRLVRSPRPASRGN